MKTLMLDLETAPITANVWRLFKENIGINQVIQDSYVLCWTAKWEHEDELISDALHYHPTLWKSDHTNDRIIMGELWKLVDEADIIVAHNADRFDIPVMNARFLAHGMHPPSPYRSIDTLKIARRKFRLASNKLDWLSRFLKIGTKVRTGGFDLWGDIIHSQDTAAFDHMVEYCEKDVELLEQVYITLRSWDDKLPAKSVNTDGKTCNACGSDDIVKNGSYSTNTQIYQKYKCKSCGHNMRSRFGEKFDIETKHNILRSL